uniref:Putative tick kunitz 90 n=1 Tax=Ixodes ricinus TaxID=34613 RepID=V5HYT4_IXORI
MKPTLDFISAVTFVILACSVVDANPQKGNTSICALYPDGGPCRANWQQYFFNMTTSKCQVFTYGGCEGNENNFDDEDACQKQCHVSNVPNICSVPYEDEECRYTDELYYYNQAINKCRKVRPLRCPKTQNVFWSRNDCKNRCKIVQPQRSS